MMALKKSLLHRLFMKLCSKVGKTWHSEFKRILSRFISVALFKLLNFEPQLLYLKNEKNHNQLQRAVKIKME